MMDEALCDFVTGVLDASGRQTTLIILLKTRESMGSVRN